MSLKNKIISTADIKTAPVEVPEWDCTLFVKTLTGTERAAFFRKAEECRKNHAETDVVVHLVILTACDEHGVRLFNDADFAALSEKNVFAIDRVATAAGKLNGFDRDAVEDAKKN